MELKTIFKLWCAMLIATLATVSIFIAFLDIPLARLCLGFSHHVSGLSRALGSSILVSCEITLMACLAILRIVRGTLSQKSNAVFIATAASLLAFVANDYMLKVIFGRKNPFQFFHDGVAGQFLFFHGNQNSSFPSGHMVLATAFAATVVRIYPRSAPFFVLLLSVGALLLVIGTWHFAADVVAGAFVGATTGLLAGELWLRHIHTHRSIS